ncbi:hypothetical protein ACLMJK_007053 [Lecanora helva]
MADRPDTDWLSSGANEFWSQLEALGRPFPPFTDIFRREEELLRQEEAANVNPAPVASGQSISKTTSSQSVSNAQSNVSGAANESHSQPDPSGSLHSSHSDRSSQQHHINPEIGTGSREPPADKRFQCTWCERGFDVWEDCVQHEKATHARLSQYICLPYGRNSLIRNAKCNFCMRPVRHFCRQFHHTEECLGKTVDERIYSVRINLVQHIEENHFPIEGRALNLARTHWRKAGKYNESDKVWECGFCDTSPRINWTERCDHVRDHFNEGARVSD